MTRWFADSYDLSTFQCRELSESGSLVDGAEANLVFRGSLDTYCISRKSSSFSDLETLIALAQAAQKFSNFSNIFDLRMGVPKHFCLSDP